MNTFVRDQIPDAVVYDQIFGQQRIRYLNFSLARVTNRIALWDPLVRHLAAAPVFC